MNFAALMMLALVPSTSLAAPLARPTNCERAVTNAALARAYEDIREAGVDLEELTAVGVEQASASLYYVSVSNNSLYEVSTEMRGRFCAALSAQRFEAAHTVDLHHGLRDVDFVFTHGSTAEILLPAARGEQGLAARPSALVTQTWSGAECRVVGMQRWFSDRQEGWKVLVDMIAGADRSGCQLLVSSGGGDHSWVRLSIQ